ncbi:AbiH family protein [Vagococcus xieshaowenii]|uniref:Bacteriophage abortive infection AbiH n=1 Tax=Vagococcus xieshaowenii TaxID=2562451 RepID=A0AAJ5EEE0_9ENTE|nr:AbiH family protein [Vagococcus xieshaowenii]QCA28740.1 hypothetical protein E4Z98_05200 [Vagococcus xieshaowenii]TFZ40452.1 hypothetical protein E4031_06575 [Vagococcus xieshaowenii]
MKNKLAIIGNGFDISHGLKTGYLDFANTLPIDIKKEWEKILIESEVHPKTWYSFEDAIDKITAKWQEQYFNTIIKRDDEFTEEVLLKKIEEINTIFFKMNTLLMEYLLGEDYKTIELKSSVKKILDFDTNIINFNYTGTVEKYVKSCIYYVHGSLMESEIVLGYKQRVEQTGIMSEATVFDKKKLREQLNFKRYLISLGLSKKALEKEMSEFKSHVRRMFSGRGGYVFDYSPALNKEFFDYINEWYKEKGWSTFNRFRKVDPIIYPLLLDEQLRNERLQQISPIINDYGEINNFSPAPISMNIDFTNVKELIILGHSLEADEELIVDIINELDNLEKIKLFVYSGEDYSNKINFLNNVSEIKAQIVYY